MKENTNQHTGRKYLCLVRCSTAMQADTSIPDQLKLLRSYGDDNGMIYTDSIVLDGVTGSVPGARSDVEQIIQRKQAANDFDMLLVQDMSRFTRSGAEHGMKLEYDLNAAGIDVVYVADKLPDGDHSGILKSVGFYAAQQTAKSLSYAVTRGLMSSLESGRIAHTVCAPYGVDRLLVTSDDKPLYIIRNLSDGTQQKLDPQTLEVLATFESERGQKRAVHYRMQANEKVVLIPGDPERVATVRHMFRRRLIDGWAGFRIARELDQMGARSSNGRPWSVTTINNMLANPVYTGVGIANRYSQGIYNRRSKNAPKPSMSDRKSLANRKKPKQQIRPREEWIEIELPLLRDYLGDLRDLAVGWQRDQLTKQTCVITKASKDRHVDSGYFLKGILKSTDGDPLTGRTVGKFKHRYYAIHRGFTVPKAEKTMRRLIPANEIEQLVLDNVRAMILETSDLRQRLVSQIDTYRKANNTIANDLTMLEAEQKKLSQQIEFLIDSLGSVGMQAAKTKLQQLEAKLSAVIEKLERARSTNASDERPAGAVADEMIARLTKIASTLSEMPKPMLRSLLLTLIEKLEVDMATKAIQLDLTIPMGVGENLASLEDKTVQKSVYQACSDFRPIMASFRCRGIERRHLRLTTCFECQRRMAA